MTYITFIILLMLTSCSTTADKNDLTRVIDVEQEHELVQKAKQYPNLNILFAYFSAEDADPAGIANPSPQYKHQSRSFNVIEKRHMLRTLDFVRFVVNLPEFEQAMSTQEMYLGRANSGPLGSIEAGKQADGQHVFDLLRQFSYTLDIKKINGSGFGAVAVLGQPNYKYPKPQNSPEYALWLGYPNAAKLDQGGYIQDSYYHAGVMLHEIMHNLGFAHGSAIPAKKLDVVCATTLVYHNISKEIVTEGTHLYTKYKHQLDKFRPFYESRHRDMLLKETYLDEDVPKQYASKTRNINTRTLKTTIHTLPNNEKELLYILDE